MAQKDTFKKTVISAVANLSTAYNLVNINLAHVVMQNQYCGGDHCKGSVTAAGTACLVGAIVGQLSFGYIGDCLGRGRAMQLTLILSILGALASAFAVPISDDKTSVFVFLSVTRLIMGIGVGGVYPLSATIAAENADNEKRGRNVSLVFSMQGVATVLVPLIGMVFLYGFGTYEQRSTRGDSLPGIAWRLMLGIGALPGIILMPFQIAGTNSSNANTQSTNTGLTLAQALSTRAYWKSIIGCAGGWFLFDITFYGNTLFAPTVLQQVFGHFNGEGYTPTIGHTLETDLTLQLFILAMIGLPGYYISVCFMDSLGRKNIQVQGFLMMAILYGILAIALDPLKKQTALLLIIYGLTYFFSNFGPNSTTFILPSESFPFEVRTSLNGFCAAMGKAGATLGSACFKPIVNSSGKNSDAGTHLVFVLCAVCALLGVAISIICIEDRRGRGMKGTSFIDVENPRNGQSVQTGTSLPQTDAGS